ncbi:MAG TPA: fibronectin type III domain-containing protein [Thermoanaerobaculia bacterium]|nr:fibronectin type III domain-containing protein [Thermoanaerobaculia bacterium]
MARLALLLALAPALFAQPLFFGDAVPQTHTRYGAFGAQPRLTTNGQHVFLFWANDEKVRVTKLVDGEKRAGRPVLDVNFGWFDVVWTGSHFLVAAYDRTLNTSEIRGRLLSANGDPIGETFTIVARFGRPRLAFDGARVLMVYGPTERGEMYSILLRPDGTQATDPRHRLIAPTHSLESVVATGGPGFVAATSSLDQIKITTFQPNTDVADSAQFTLPPLLGRRVAIGSNGQDALAVWTNGSGAVEYTTVRANGTISGPTAIAGTEGSFSAAVAWNGTKWVVSTIASGKLQTRLIDGASFTQASAYELSPVSLVSLNGRTLAAWGGTGAGQPVLVRDVSASNNGETAAFGAAEQTLQTATSSHEAALIVWSELRDGRRTLHAGARTTSGGWSENRIGDDEDAPLAASDGNLFLVVKKSNAGWSAVTLTGTAQVTASTPVVTSFTPTGITWDGGGWAVIGVSPQKNIYAVRVMPWGAVSAPVLISERSGTHELASPRIVFGGGGFFAVWQDHDFVSCFPICDPFKAVLHGARLTPTLQRIDVQNLELAPDEALSPDVFWDGTRYVIFWVNGGALETRTVRPNASGSGITRVAGARIDTGELRATLTPFGAAIASNDGEVLLVRDGSLVTRYDLGRANATDTVVNLGPEVAYVQAAVQDDMPYHGAPHLFLRVGGVLPPSNVPDPPKIVRASMMDGGNVMLVNWRPPLDPVNGYRIEYRVNDGVWNELDQWFDAATTSMSIRPWLDGARYQFRIRAWSDAGVSGYSIPATVRLLGRRRSVR